MPYIKHARQRLTPLSDWAATSAGELNFQVTTLVLQYLANHGENYVTYNDLIGALECAKLELYRRRVAPYEDDAKERNGDVY